VHDEFWISPLKSGETRMLQVFNKNWFDTVYIIVTVLKVLLGSVADT
jgi:hypothetical protein